MNFFLRINFKFLFFFILNIFFKNSIKANDYIIKNLTVTGDANFDGNISASNPNSIINIINDLSIGAQNKKFTVVLGGFSATGGVLINPTGNENILIGNQNKYLGQIVIGNSSSTTNINGTVNINSTSTTNINGTVNINSILPATTNLGNSIPASIINMTGGNININTAGQGATNIGLGGGPVNIGKVGAGASPINFYGTVNTSVLNVSSALNIGGGNGINLGAGKFVVNGTTGAVSISNGASGSLNISGPLIVTGAITSAGLSNLYQLVVKNLTRLQGGLYVTGGGSITGDINVTGNINTNGLSTVGTVNINTTTGATATNINTGNSNIPLLMGNTVSGGPVTISTSGNNLINLNPGTPGVAINGNLSVSGNANINTLTVGCGLDLTSCTINVQNLNAIQSINLTGSALIGTDLQINGNLNTNGALNINNLSTQKAYNSTNILTLDLNNNVKTIQINDILTLMPPSSERYKENIKDLKFNENDFLEIRPVEFNYKEETDFYDDKNINKIGVIAEELFNSSSEILKSLVIFKDGMIESLDYNKLFMINVLQTIKNLKELLNFKDKFLSLEEENQSIKNDFYKIKDEYEKLKIEIEIIKKLLKIKK